MIATEFGTHRAVRAGHGGSAVAAGPVDRIGDGHGVRHDLERYGKRARRHHRGGFHACNSDRSTAHQRTFLTNLEGSDRKRALGVLHSHACHVAFRYGQSHSSLIRD
ncbi:hypothetical protein [Streptomyces sp. Ru72]|uniref:hypothetical protein n=1 Tax=Streptomyces sp. Ru72 TaxID=2080747 RepID=UPI001CA49C8A|nr:hypothetical protein [Streptomyces sp. Ru72]